MENFKIKGLRPSIKSEQDFNLTDDTFYQNKPHLCKNSSQSLSPKKRFQMKKNISLKFECKRNNLFNLATNKNDNRSQPFETLYHVYNLIGKGGSSKVKECQPKGSKIKCAVKIVRCEDIEKYFIVMEEARILKMAQHDNIVKLYDFYYDRTQKNSYIVMEYAQGVQLGDYIQQGNKLSKLDIKLIIQQVIEVLIFLHSNNLCHRDITPYNIIYDLNKKNIKVLDFGISKDLKTDCQKMHTQCGNHHFLAPEMINNGSYDARVDVWQLGILTYFLLTNKFPYKFKTDAELYKKISTGNINLDGIQDEQAKQFLQSILILDPFKRPHASQLIYSPYLTNSHQELFTHQIQLLYQQNNMNKKMNSNYLHVKLPKWSKRKSCSQLQSSNNTTNASDTEKDDQLSQYPQTQNNNTNKQYTIQLALEQQLDYEQQNNININQQNHDQPQTQISQQELLQQQQNQQQNQTPLQQQPQQQQENSNKNAKKFHRIKSCGPEHTLLLHQQHSELPNTFLSKQSQSTNQNYRHI